FMYPLGTFPLLPIDEPTEMLPPLSRTFGFFVGPSEKRARRWEGDLGPRVRAVPVRNMSKNSPPISACSAFPSTWPEASEQRIPIDLSPGLPPLDSTLPRVSQRDRSARTGRRRSQPLPDATRCQRESGWSTQYQALAAVLAPLDRMIGIEGVG